MPAGVFNLVNGDGPDVGQAIAGHPDVDMVSFTGSTRAGIMVAKAAADTVKRVAQELGGKSANIILRRRRFRRRAVRQGRRAAASATAASPAMRRRACSCRADAHAEALAIAKEAAESHKVGDPRDAEDHAWARWSARCSSTRSRG